MYETPRIDVLFLMRIKKYINEKFTGFDNTNSVFLIFMNACAFYKN